MAAPSDTAHPEGERETLLPCPFCGGRKLKNVTDDGPAWTKCETCEATGPTTFKYQEDGPDWNTRSTQPSRPQGEEGLREALEGMLAAVKALGETPPGRKDAYFEAPLLETDDGVFRWEALDRAVKRARQALAAISNQGKPAS